MNALGKTATTEINPMTRGQLILLKLEAIRALQTKPERSSIAVPAEGQASAQEVR